MLCFDAIPEPVKSLLVRLAPHAAFFTAKYPGTDPFTVIRSLAWFDDAECEPDPVSLTGATWDRVKATVSNMVAGI